MALVAQIMAQGKFSDLNTGDMPDDPYVLIHSDIKPLNSKHLFLIVSVCSTGLTVLISMASNNMSSCLHLS